MSTGFTKAVRSRRKLKVALDGVSGAGKSFSALRLAYSLVQAGMGTRVAVIDTENESSSLYAGESPDGITWDFESMNLKQFGPDVYTGAIALAFKSGFDILVIDSLSHAWNAEGGALDLVDKKGGNKFAGWKDVTPLHRRMVDAIINAPGHVIATMRSKTEYVMEQNERGQAVPRKVGMAPVQRDGMEYEFDVYGSIDATTQMIRITKSRCPALNGATGIKPGPIFWQPLFDWLNSAAPSAPSVYAEPPPPVTKDQLTQMSGARAAWLLSKEITGEEEQAAAWAELLIPYGVGSATKLTRAEASQLIADLARLTVVSAESVIEPLFTPPEQVPTEPVPAPVETAPTATPTEQPDRPATMDQKAELARLHPFVMTAFGAKEKPAQRAAWEQTLAPFNVASINEMTYAVAAKAIQEIGTAHDPFTYQRSPAGAAG